MVHENPGDPSWLICLLYLISVKKRKYGHALNEAPKQALSAIVSNPSCSFPRLALSLSSGGSGLLSL